MASSNIIDYVPMMTRRFLGTKHLVFYILFTYSTLFIMTPRIFLLNKKINEWGNFLETFLSWHSQLAFYHLCLGDTQSFHKNTKQPFLPWSPHVPTSISIPCMITHMVGTSLVSQFFIIPLLFLPFTSSKAKCGSQPEMEAMELNSDD